MGILCRHSSIRLSDVTFFFACLLLVSTVSSIRLINNSIRKPGLGGGWAAEAAKERRRLGWAVEMAAKERRRLGWAVEMAKGRRRLGVLGSWPPACKSKCGVCSPCDAVHVPIQPGFSTPQEYYPEAWRCKCGNKLFMP